MGDFFKGLFGGCGCLTAALLAIGAAVIGGVLFMCAGLGGLAKVATDVDEAIAEAKARQAEYDRIWADESRPEADRLSAILGEALGTPVIVQIGDSETTATWSLTTDNPASERLSASVVLSQILQRTHPERVVLAASHNDQEAFRLVFDQQSLAAYRREPMSRREYGVHLLRSKSESSLPEKWQVPGETH